MSTGPAEGRGGDSNPMDVLRRSKLHKAAQGSVVKAMGANQEPAQEPGPASATENTPEYTPEPAHFEKTTASAPAPAVEVAVAPELALSAPVEVPAADKAETVTEPPTEEGETKRPATKKTSFHQPEAAGARMRSTFLETRHLTRHKTLSEFICAIIDQECERLEKEYNGGEHFDTDAGEVPRGRPVGG